MRKGEYAPGLDSEKLIAAFGVIAIHIAPSNVEGERPGQFFSVFAVSFFLIVSLRFFIASQSRKSTMEILYAMFARIVVPYACWTSVYLGAFLLKDSFTNGGRQIDWLGSISFGASAVHLYFLPVLLAMQIWVLMVHLMRCAVTRRFVPAVVFLSVAALAYYGFHKGYMGWGLTAAFPIFATLGWLAAKYDRTLKESRVALSTGILVFGVAVGMRQFRVDAAVFNVPVDFLLGGASFYLLSLHLPRIASRTVLSSSYGIYLSHFLFLEGIEYFLQRLGLVEGAYSLLEKCLFSAIVFGLSLGMVLCFRKHALLARLFLGEDRMSQKISSEENETSVGLEVLKARR